MLYDPYVEQMCVDGRELQTLHFGYSCGSAVVEGKMLVGRTSINFLTEK